MVAVQQGPCAPVETGWQHSEVHTHVSSSRAVRSLHITHTHTWKPIGVGCGQVHAGKVVGGSCWWVHIGRDPSAEALQCYTGFAGEEAMMAATRKCPGWASKAELQAGMAKEGPQERCRQGDAQIRLVPSHGQDSPVLTRPDSQQRPKPSK